MPRGVLPAGSCLRKLLLSQFHCWQRSTRSREARTSALTSLESSRNFFQYPPVHALRDALALPSGVFGPVDCSHGFQVRINAACRALRSGVQEVAMLMLQ